MQILSGLILLAVLIVFHELGHFLFAKMLGVRVLVFSLGFGPKIFGFKIGDTEYRLSAIPLGGYVRMFGESLDEELSEEEKKRSFIHQAVWRKSLIAVAGPLFNFILPVILFFFLLVGKEQVYAPTVGTLLKDSVAEKAGIKPDDRILAVNGRAVETFTDLAQQISEGPGQKLSFTIKRPLVDEKVVITLVPESKAAPSPFDKGKIIGRIGIMPAIEKATVIVDKDSAFYAAGVRDFDEILAINGLQISSMHTLQQALKDAGEKVSLKIRRKEEGKEKELTLEVLNTPKNLKAPSAIKVINNVEPKDLATSALAGVIAATSARVAEEQILSQKMGLSSAKGAIVEVSPLTTAAILGLKPDDRVVAIDGEKITSDLQLQQSLMQEPKNVHVLGVLSKDGQGLIYTFRLPENIEESLKLDNDLASIFGISTAAVFKSGEVFERHVSVGEALKRALAQTWAIAAMTGKSLWMLVSGEVSASQVGGPIMIFDVAQQAAHKGLSYYIFIMCLLSVNLGLLNLLPIPALDGGHLLLFGIEAIQRKPLTPKTRAIATQIGITLLLALMALALFNDLYRLFK